MKQEGKFLLLDLAEFESWLSGLKLKRKILIIQNHHTWLPDYTTFKGNNHFKLLNSMETSHLERGFSQIAQNITTFPDGTVAICRPFEEMPAGIKGANGNGICIEHVGNFDKGKDKMTNAHRETIIEVNRLLCTRFKLIPSTDTVVYHHWYDLTTGARVAESANSNTKSCPGTDFFGGNTVAACKANFIPLLKAIAVNA
jgi:hypothetical protein